jgi:DNA-binding transcriptional LysR family regulator
VVDLNELQIFAQLGKTQSFTLAARRLGTQKSAVSRALTSLETRLGVRLVERTTRRVALTEAGELFLEKCLRVLEEAEQADLAINMMHSKPRGRLRVGAPAAFVRFVLAPLLGGFVKEYPEVKLSLQIIQGPPMPSESGLDIAIRQGPLDDSAMRVMPLRKISLGLYAGSGYVAEQGVPEAPAGLRNHRFITTNCGAHGEPAEFVKISLRRGALTETIRVESHICLTDPSLNLQLAISNAGIAQLSQSIAQPNVAAGRLVRILPEWEPAAIELFAVYASRLSSSPKLRAFLEYVRKHSESCDTHVKRTPRP